MKPRGYHSPARQKQADATKTAIVDAARRLLSKHGFDGTTIDAIAREAGVSTPTVYAAFGSKAGIVKELMNAARFGPAYASLLEQVHTTKDPVQQLTFAPRIARQVYLSERQELELLRGASAMSAELAAIAHQKEDARFEAQGELVKALHAAKKLKKGLTLAAARDALWALTSRDLFRSLVIERQWSADRYEAWLGELIRAALL